MSIWYHAFCLKQSHKGHVKSAHTPFVLGKFYRIAFDGDFECYSIEASNVIRTEVRTVFDGVFE